MPGSHPADPNVAAEVWNGTDQDISREKQRRDPDAASDYQECFHECLLEGSGSI